jgi:hypothetical protein
MTIVTFDQQTKQSSKRRPFGHLNFTVICHDGSFLANMKNCNYNKVRINSACKGTQHF